MTVLEAKYNYGTRRISANYGETLRKLVRRLYNSEEDIYFNVLKALNNRFDWFNIEPGAPIEYFSSQVVSQISQVW